MVKVYAVPGTALEVHVNETAAGKYYIYNPNTRNYLYADRVHDPKTGKRFYREDIISKALSNDKVVTAKLHQQDVVKTKLLNNTVAVCEEDGYSKLFYKDTDVCEVVGELTSSLYSLSDIKLVDLVTLQEIKINVNLA